MKPAVCERCGAPVTAGSSACGYCGVLFVGSSGATGADGAAGFGSATATAMPADVVAALRAGNKIDAIRLYRGHRKCGLREAKDAVEAMEARLPRG